MQEPRAIPFIVKDFAHDTYHLTNEAEILLSTIHTPISVVTVAGLYRTGKSYLLNRVILNRAGGFGVGPTVNPCTKGLWIWGEPIPMGGRTLLVVDTEGLGALDEQSNHDMKIFCLAVLLSSNFIYNSVGSIDQTALQTLSFVLNLIAGIDKESYSSRPNFLWVVRDFSLQLINDKGQSLTPSQYLQLALSTQNQKQSQKLQIRKTILEAFTERQCFTLIKPLIDQNKLQNLDKIPTEELRPEFVSQTISLRKYIYQSLREVRINGSVPLHGQDYMLMCKRFLAAINGGAVPNLLDTWGYIKEEKARQAVEQVRQNYNQKLRGRLGNKLPIPSNRLGELLQSLRQEAFEEFKQLSYEEQSNEELKSFIEVSEAQMNRLNSKQCKAALSQILKRQFQPFQKKILSNFYSDPTSYQLDLRNNFRLGLQEKYSERLDLPLMQIQLYTQKRIVEGVKLFEKRSRDETIKARQTRSEIEGTLQNEIRSLNRTLQQQRHRMQEDIFGLEKKIIMLNNQKQRLEDHYTKERRDQEAQNIRTRRKIEENQQQIEGLQKELIRLQELNGESDRQIFYFKKELQKQKALSKQKQEHLELKLIQLDRRNTSLQQQIQTGSRSWQSQRRQFVIQLQARTEKAVKQKKQLYDQLSQTSNLLQHERSVCRQLNFELESLKERHQQDMVRLKQRWMNSTKKDNRSIESENQLMRQLQDLQKRELILAEQLKDSESKYRQLQQQLKLFRSQSDKQEAIANQKIEFQQIEVQQLRMKLQQANSNYQSLYRQCQQNNSQNIQLSLKRKISEITAEHLQALKENQNQKQQMIALAKKEAEQYLRQKEEAHQQLETYHKRWESREKYLENTANLLKRQCQELRQQLSMRQEGHAMSQREKESYYSLRVRQLQAQIEQVKRQSSQELEDILMKSEQTVNFIKTCSQQQKAQFEKRLEEEKAKRERKMQEINEEWTTRFNQQKQHYQSMVGELEGRLLALNSQYTEQLQNIKCDAQIRIQKVNNAALEERMELTKKLALVEQQSEIIRANLTNKLEQSKRNHQSAMENLKKELLSECQQQVKAAKQAMEQVQQRLDSLKKANRKVQESNLLLKSEFDRQKGLSKQKEQAASRNLKVLEQRFANELRNNTQIIEGLKDDHTKQTRKLNEQIQRIKEQLLQGETERIKLESAHQEERNSLMTKNNYLEAKSRRAKEEYEDLLRKFETSVKKISQQNQQKQVKKEMNEAFQKLRDQYNAQIRDKQDALNHERKEIQEKVMRLQTQNKSLRDKLLLLEMRQTHQSSRYDIQPPEKQERPLRDLKQQFEFEKNQGRRYYK